VATRSREHLAEPRWRGRADAWFKLLGAIAVAYLILARLVGYLNEFGDVTVIAVGGLLLSYLVLPVVRWLNLRLPLWAAITIVYAAIVLLIALALSLLVPTISQEFQALVAALPQMRAVAQRYLSTTNNPIITHIPEPLRGYLVNIPTQVSAQLEGIASSLTLHVFPALVSLVNVLVLAVAIPVVSVYMLAESAQAKRFFARFVPEGKRAAAVDLLADIDAVIGGFVRGQLIVAAIVAVMAIIALLILHVPYAVLIGIFAGVTDVIPYVGPIAGVIVAMFVALIANGWQNAVAVIIAFIIINQVEAHILGPRIVSSTVKVSPLTVIFALLIGGHVFGFLGLIIAVPIAGLIRVILERLFPEKEITNAEIRPGLTPSPRGEVDPNGTEA
jgi:predicted PurR-regulated permease PerM